MRVFVVSYTIAEEDARTTHIIELVRNLKKRCKVTCFASKLMGAKHKFPGLVNIPILNKGFFAYQYRTFQ